MRFARTSLSRHLTSTIASQPADHLAGFRIPTVVIMFSAIGLLITANLILRIPDAGLTVEQFNTFRSPLAARSRTAGNLLHASLDMERAMRATGLSESAVHRVAVIGGATAIVMIALLFAKPFYSAMTNAKAA